MPTIEGLLDEFSAIAEHPEKELEKHIASGKKVIGVGPYYVPEELVYAAGAIPFGVWGCVGAAVEAKKYFPPFYCSICQMTLEMGLNHQLDALSGMMVTGLCDTLRAFSQNFKAGVSTVPMIYVSQAQNRALPAGRTYTLDSYREVARKVEECADALIDDAALSEAIKLYNVWRFEMRMFVNLAATHPQQVSVAARSAVIDAGYYMDKAEHLSKLQTLNALLGGEADSTQGYKRIVLSGIYEDIPAIESLLDEDKFVIAADDIAKESRAFAITVPETGDPYEALADAWCAIEGDSLAYDPDKKHVSKVVDLVGQSGAKGVVILLAKFCDPEEFDAPLITKACRDAGIPIVTIEIDQSTESYEQARTQLETFGEMLA